MSIESSAKSKRQAIAREMFRNGPSRTRCLATDGWKRTARTFLFFLVPATKKKENEAVASHLMARTGPAALFTISTEIVAILAPSMSRALRSAVETFS